MQVITLLKMILVRIMLNPPVIGINSIECETMDLSADCRLNAIDSLITNATGNARVCGYSLSKPLILSNQPTKEGTESN